MDTQWWVLGFALALTGLTVSALVRPERARARQRRSGRPAAGSPASSRRWLGAAAIVVLVLVATHDGRARRASAADSRRC